MNAPKLAAEFPQQPIILPKRTFRLPASSLLVSIFLIAALQGQVTSNIAAVWANDGGDKVTQQELRASNDSSSVINFVWDGNSIKLFGARNEVVSFNLVLEASTVTATGVNVSLTSLTGPAGTGITTRPANGDAVFSFIGRNIELFYVRYLQIKGLSRDMFYDNYDERHIPQRCRRPYDQDGNGDGSWTDRACHDKFYPEILIPLELQSPFTITAANNQSIWGDIYIPKGVPAGNYSGTILVTENGQLTWEIPIHLNVRSFTVPDLPSAKTMLYLSHENINTRYLGPENAYPEPGSNVYAQSLELADRHFQLAHRHRISLIGNPQSYTPVERMGDEWAARLTGELFTPPKGYSGPGVGVGNNVYAIGEYAGWPWQGGAMEEMWTRTDEWVNWFDEQLFATDTEYFLYLIDESDDFPQTEQWAQWIDSNPGPGQRLMSMATIALPTAEANTPSLDMPTSWVTVGITDQWQSAADNYSARSDKRVYLYNSNRPSTGSFAIEDDGVALRVLPWAQYKKGIDRWFYWESTYYNNFQGEMGQTNVFERAQTFGSFDGLDPSLGETGFNYLNGDGVLFYPGTDTLYPSSSYGVQGPFASQRLKLWRRGIQDVDYLSLAKAVEPTAVEQIVNRMIPKVLWEYGVSDLDDPNFVLTDISWSNNPDDWEQARARLVDIIENKLYFPFYQTQGSSFVGFAVSNFSNDQAELVFRTFGPEGSPISFSAQTSNFQLQSGSQFALLGNEIFGTNTSTPQAGWIELVTDNSQIGGFFQFGDLDRLDGAVAFTEQSKKFYFTRVFEGPTAFRGRAAKTYLSIANPNAETITLTLKLFHRQDTANQNMIAEQTKSIPPKGVFYGSVLEIFGSNLSVSSGYIEVEVTDGDGAVGFELIQLTNHNTVIGLSASFGNSVNELFSAQLASGPGIFTNVKLVNISAENRQVTLRVTHESGADLAEPVEITLTSGELFEQDAAQIFGLAAGATSVGSLSFVTDGPGIIGDIVFGDPSSLNYAAALQLQTQKFTQAIFNHVANLTGTFFTGLAFYNPGPETATITIEVFSAPGESTGTSSLELESSKRVSQTLEELVPSTVGQVGGYILVGSNQPLIAQELFGTATLTLMSGVPPTILQ